MSNCFIMGRNIYLRTLNETDVNETYLQWMNDYEVTRYTESRFYPHTISSLLEFVKSANTSNNITFAIIDKSSEKHIGNIKLGGINWIHRYADLGLIIGAKEYWGKGIGKEAIEIVTTYAFKSLNLRKIYSGIYANNTGSIKAFEYNGYAISHIHKSKYYFEGQYIDSVVCEKTNGID